jgi:hypothetical protein
VLGVACRERPPHELCRTLGVAHSGQALIELRAGLVGNPLQGFVEVITGVHGELRCHARVGRVSQDVHMDLAASTPKLTIWVTTVCRSLHVAEMVKHVPEQCRKAGVVQPITTEPSVDPEGGVGLVVHLSTTRKK